MISERVRPAAGAGGEATGSRRGGKVGTQGGGSTSAAAPPWPGQVQSPMVSIHTWVREILGVVDIPGDSTNRARETQALHEAAQAPRRSSGAPDLTGVAEAERALGGFGEVEF